MAEDRSSYRIFISSPSDCKTEREIAEEVIGQLNADAEIRSRMRLECSRYESKVAPDALRRPQAIIDEEIGEYEIYVGILADRFGTPTGDAGSGTEHEFRYACKRLEEGKCLRITFYFSSGGKRCSTLDDCDQRRQVLAFRDGLKDKSLFREYRGRSDFKRKFGIDIRNCLRVIILRTLVCPA